jgi:pyruvate/2-oxoglutarate dehydrogenase complex dihydrolipoamide acyltransferase (E2) component
MYTGVNDIMWLDRGPRSSLGNTLLVTCLKALTTDPPSAELVTLAAGYEPLCANQAARATLLAIMPTLDDVDIAPVQRGDQSRGVVIPGSDGTGGVTGGHSHGGVPAGGGPAGGRSGASAGGQGGTTGSSSAAALGKGKQTCVILDDDEVSSNEDEPLQKRLWQLSGAGPAVRDEAAADKWVAEEATMKRSVEEAAAKQAVEEATAKRAAVKRAAEEAAAKQAVEEAATKRAVEEAVVKAVAAEEATVKRAIVERAAEEATAKAAAVEAIGAAGGSPAPSQAPPTAGAKRSAAPSGSTPPAKHPYRGVWKPRFVQLSPPFSSFFLFLFCYYLFV